MIDGAADHRALAASLAPRLEEACHGRIESITWFRTDWQRGGAATGFALWCGEEGNAADPDPVVIKIPVNRRELTWLRRLQRSPRPPNGEGDASAAHAGDDRTQRGSPESSGGNPVVPRLYASGESIGGYDLAWVVMERFACGPLGMEWHDGHVGRMARAIAAFHAATSPFDITDSPRHENWLEHLDGSMEVIETNPLPEQARWKRALRRLRPKMEAFADIWESRPATDWLHGDPHFANAMTRSADPDAPVALIDLAEVRAGHWVEDAVYMERQLWGRPELMHALKPLRAVAGARKAAGLSNGPKYGMLARVRRTLLAASAPRFIRSEGRPRHLLTCLELLEEGLADPPDAPE